MTWGISFLFLKRILKNVTAPHVYAVDATDVFPQVVSAAGSVCAEGTQVGFFPRVCLEVVAHVLATVPAVEGLTTHRTHQGWPHCLKREHSHP